MRRLIPPRGVRLLLAAAVTAAVIVVIVRARSATARSAPTPAPAPGPAVAPPWPPAPILGTPTAEDLSRYAARPSVLDRPGVRAFLEGGPKRQPLDEAARRRLTRWGAAGLALCLLAAGTHVLETMVYTRGPVAEPSYTLHLYRHQDDLTHERATRSAPPVPVVDADCRPEPREPRVRPLHPKIVRAVDRQWRRIETWLRAHAPRSHRTLGAPARPETIAAAEAQMGVRFPDDLRASLLRHEGNTAVPGTVGFGFLGTTSASVREIRDTWRMLCGIDGGDHTDGPDIDPRSDWWDGRMLPVGANGMGDHLVVDSVRRDVGQTDHEGTMSFTPGGARIRSYHALLKATADALETGGSLGYWKPTVVAGRLDWQVQ